MSATNSARSTKIKILLGIDTVFFFVELISGYTLGSLALVADSFHMLNDVCSLIVALQAIKLAESSSTSNRYSYGWQRAEVLGALINGVFLLALCFSIGMEAIQRFFNATVVTNPQIVVAVGSAGLLSNIVGLFLFHDHGHSHGGHSHGHSHSHGGDLEAAKPKVKHVHSGHSHSHNESNDRTPLLSNANAVASSAESATSTTDSTVVRSRSNSNSSTETERAEDELFVHPGEFRANVVKAAHDAGYGATVPSTHKRTMSTSSRKSVDMGHSHSHAGHDHGEEGHDHGDHEHEEESGGHGGHSHEGSMNMRGVFLHVLGDALGNVGVIGAGLIIWLSDYSWKYYSDPAISLIITCIIFSSALPLVKSASFILLQGVPSSIPLELVRTAIVGVPGVLNVHELHVWSLSESKTVASVHIMVKNKDDVVEVSKKIRKVMHRFGIHSSTIQPEIVGQKATTSVPASALDPESDGCMIQCVDDSCAANTCCPPVAGEAA